MWKHSTTGKSLFEVLYRFNPLYLVDLALETKVPIVAEHLQLIHTTQEEATASLQMAAQYTKHWDVYQNLL